ncbi:MAG TPA: hypothetical protein VIR78_01725 [Malonomonas sp.]
MKHPEAIFVRQLLFLLLLFFSSTVTSVHAAAPIALTQIEKQEQISSTRMTFHFSELPQFKVNRSGQRVELELTGVRAAAQLRQLPEDEKVVKFLLAQKHDALLVSMLLRRPPADLATATLSNPPRLVLDLFWEGDQAARPSVAFRIADMPPRKTGKKATEFNNKSPWQDDWPSFIRDYRSDWQLKLPLVYSLPELPPLVTDEQSPLWPLQQLAKEKMWLSLLRESAKVTPADKEQSYLLHLLVAEAQLLSGSLDAGAVRLEQLQQADGSHQERVDYLTAYGQALGHQPFVAQLSLQPLLAELPADDPLRAPIYLLAAETALASNQDQLALDYLQNSEVSWPDSYQLLVDLRSADARVMLDEQAAALDSYAELSETAGLFEAQRFSCNRAAYAAYTSGNYQLARQFYLKLTAALHDVPGADLALWGLGASSYLAGVQEWGLIELKKATLEYPATEGGDRAALLLVDHQLLESGEMGMVQASQSYRQLGKQSGHWKVREEATFKSALSLFLVGDHKESVETLMRFLREFSSSDLKHEAQLLLVEQIPKLVRQLLADKKELEAVVLVEKNRNLLLRDGPDREFLFDLSRALERLGLYERSSRVLLFLYDQTKEDKQRQVIYLPLARSFLKRGEFALASDYASRYLKKYPRGEAAGSLFGLLLDAFAAQGRDEELLAWLGRMNRPRSIELERRAATIFWQQQRYGAVADSLEWIADNGGTLQVKEMALLGESYYQQQKNRAAEKLFNQLLGDPQVGIQAGYRTAQLLLQQNQRGAALNLLQQLVEKDGSSAWGKLAQDLLYLEKSRVF